MILLAAAAVVLLCPACGGGGGSLTADLGSGQVANSTGNAEPVNPLAPAIEVPDGVDPDVYRMLSQALAAMLEEMPEERRAAGVPTGTSANVRDLRTTIRSTSSYYLTWSYTNSGDYDQNTIVTGSDITMVGQYFGAYEGDENWPAARFADGNHDGVITVADLTAIGANYGNQIRGYNIYRSANYQDHPSYHGGVTGVGAELIGTTMKEISSTSSTRGYSFSMDIPYDGYYYWVVPTDGENEGNPSNLAGGILEEWPYIEAVTPAHGLPGTTVRINGTNFGTENPGTLEMNGLALEIDSWSDTEIITCIPEGADDCMIRVYVDYMFADSPEFVVATAPVVEACEPYLEFGRPFSVVGENFRSRQGTGLLFIDDEVHPITEWSDTRLNAAFLNPQRTECDEVAVQVLASNGLISEPVLLSGDFVTCAVTSDLPTGVATASSTEPGTVFTLDYEMSDGSDNYSVKLYPDYQVTSALRQDADADTPGLQFTYSNMNAPYPSIDQARTYMSGRLKYRTALELTNTDTGHTFTVEGPTLLVTLPVFVDNPLLVDIYPLSFNRSDAVAPNDICYLPAEDTFLDITFIDDEPYFTSSLVDLEDGTGNPRASFERDPRDFLKGGSDQRPYCYRVSNLFIDSADDQYNDSSVMSLTGYNFGEEPVNQAFYVPGHKIGLVDLCGWDGNDGWTDTEVRFSIGNWTYGIDGRVGYDYSNDYGAEDNHLWTVYSPVMYEIRPADYAIPLHDGLIYMNGSNLVANETNPWLGTKALTVWRVPVTYTSPWTGKTVSEGELLVRPVDLELHRYTHIYLRTADLDPDGDGLVTVEARAADDSAAQVLEAELVPGQASFFIWAGIMDEGTPQEIARSGIYSESYTFELVDNATDNVLPMASLSCIHETTEAPVEMWFSAGESYDPDGTIIDYEWDFNGDGIFNDSASSFSGTSEYSCRGNNSFTEYQKTAGDYCITVRVTDDRGATATASYDFTITDDFADFTLKLRLFNDNYTADIAPTGVQVFYRDGDSTAELELVDVFNVDHSELNGHSTSLDFPTILPCLPRGQYWFRLTNPDVDWRNYLEAQTTPHPQSMTFGPYTIPDSYDNSERIDGYVWQ